MHKPWNRKQTHNKFLEDHSKTIRTFHQMVLSNELSTSVVAQYILAIKYADKRRIEVVAQAGITQDEYRQWQERSLWSMVAS